MILLGILLTFMQPCSETGTWLLGELLNCFPLVKEDSPQSLIKHQSSSSGLGMRKETPLVASKEPCKVPIAVTAAWLVA